MCATASSGSEDWGEKTWGWLRSSKKFISKFRVQRTLQSTPPKIVSAEKCPSNYGLDFRPNLQLHSRSCNLFGLPGIDVPPTGFRASRSAGCQKFRSTSIGLGVDSRCPFDLLVLSAIDGLVSFLFFLLRNKFGVLLAICLPDLPGPPFYRKDTDLFRTGRAPT